MKLVILNRLDIAIFILFMFTFSSMLFISFPVSRPVCHCDTHDIIKDDEMNTQQIVKISKPDLATNSHNFKTYTQTGTSLTTCDLVEKGPPLDNSIIINPHPYANIVAPETDCEPGLFLVVYVHSSAAHHERRALIRRTWGNVTQYNESIRIVFIIGMEPHNKKTKENTDQFQEEILNNGDIVQYNFLDIYRNLVRKAICGLKWVIEHCRSAKYILKVDDDAFVNMYLVLDHIRMGTKSGHYGNNVLLCNFYGTDVQRNGKWKTTYEECSLARFPTYCQGLAFVMTIDVAISLFNASHYVPLLWMDDVYITGILPALLPAGAVQHINDGSYYMSAGGLKRSTINNMLAGTEAFKFLYFHIDNSTLFETAWNALSLIVHTQEFKQYAEVMFSRRSDLERTVLKRNPAW